VPLCPAFVVLGVSVLLGESFGKISLVWSRLIAIEEEESWLTWGRRLRVHPGLPRDNWVSLLGVVVVVVVESATVEDDPSVEVFRPRNPRPWLKKSSFARELSPLSLPLLREARSVEEDVRTVVDDLIVAELDVVISVFTKGTVVASAIVAFGM